MIREQVFQINWAVKRLDQEIERHAAFVGAALLDAGAAAAPSPKGVQH